MSDEFDWKAIGHFDGDPALLDVVSHAAQRVWSDYQGYVEFGDLRSEAWLMVSTREDLGALAEAGDYGLLSHALGRDLSNHCRQAFYTPRNNPDGTVKRADHSAIVRDGRLDAEGEHEGLGVAYAAIEGGLPALESLDAYVMVDAPAGGYNRESVEELLPAIWNESYSYGLDRRSNLPDPDMPRTKANPAHGNNLAAGIADIRTGWARADLTLDERRALFLAHGVGWTQRQAAFNQGVSQKTISLRVQNGISKIVAHLNGGEWFEMEEQAEEVRAA